MAEFDAYVQGYRDREERDLERDARLAAWIMAPHLTDEITADDLLGRRQSHGSSAELASHLARRRAEIEAEQLEVERAKRADPSVFDLLIGGES